MISRGKLGVLTLCLALGLAGCTQGKAVDLPGSLETEGKPDLNDRVRILASFDAQTPIVDAFRKVHPDVLVEWVKVSKDNMLEALTKEDSADLMIVDNGMIGGINDVDVFEDVSKAPYQAESLIEGTWFPGLPLESYRSLNGKQLIAIPKDVPLNFTFYREDILKKYGYPTEPAELARYLESPERWLEMAKKLKENNHWIFSYLSDPMYIASGGKGFFDKSKQYLRNDDDLEQAMNLTKAIASHSLARNLNIWDDNGKNAVRKDELVMIYIGEWAQNLLREWDPEKAGVWKMTRLPMNQFQSIGGSPS
jgi:multiple sugar transport system substrate-binding protein